MGAFPVMPDGGSPSDDEASIGIRLLTDRRDHVAKFLKDGEDTANAKISARPDGR